MLHRTPISETEGHRLPAGSIVVQPEMCGNCSRRLYVTTGDKKLCLACSNGLHLGAQVWVCVERGKRGLCGTARKWGDGAPEDRNPKQLLCERCHQVTQHDFYEVSRGCA